MSQVKIEVLKQFFGYDQFREGQEQLVDSILSGRDSVGIMPTGAGKSLCFQVPALLLDGITLVISPLISLMKDQVNALSQAGIKAAYINSSLTEKQISTALRNARNGMYKVIYIAPERLRAFDFVAFASSTNIAMVTVDEAHCVSQWGQDFRPSYLDIATFVARLPQRPVVSAFTATATPKVRMDIVQLLQLRDPLVLVTGFDRPNLHFEVQKPADKSAALMDFLSDKEGKSGIIYCSTRSAVEELCDGLNKRGYSASRYHAGLSDNERCTNQDDFLYDRVQIMVATNAFGMGIDKSNVSFVVHFNMPKNIESYYQEAGRAGRSGEPADCVLLYSGQDVRTNMYFIEKSEDAEYRDRETELMLKERDRQRLKEMTYYCHTTDCLRAYILSYFGETAPGFCGNCDNCNRSFEAIDITVDSQKILSCVVRARESYGVQMIMDILRGSRNERLLRLGLDKLSTYNISKVPEKRMREIVNYLCLHDFLYITNDKYPVLKLGSRASEVLKGKSSLEMKVPRGSGQRRATRNTPGAITTEPMDGKLFASLKELRLSIAKEQNVPAFIIFSDSTLIDMCLKRPLSNAELLGVSGVGKVKLERYGDRFLELLALYETGNNSPTDRMALSNSDTVLSPASIELSDEAVPVSVIADRMNCSLLPAGCIKTNGARINEWLIAEGYLQIVDDGTGKSSKSPTDRGRALGIVSEPRTVRGVNTSINFFSREAQQLIVDRMLEGLREEPRK